MIKRLLFLFLINIAYIQLFAQDLFIDSRDLHLELRSDGGFHLFIRKKPDISSVLITESTRDPLLREDNYAYRAGEWNPVNGDEIRLLNGAPITRESRIHSLVSSTVVNHPVLGNSFHIYLPYILYYGYESGRHGEIYLTDGAYLNIRAFSLPYADYRGTFRDNPFILEARQEPLPSAGTYLNETLASFTQIARSGGGQVFYAKNPDDTIAQIRNALLRERGKSIDIVICLDTTNSMKKYIDPIRAKLIPVLNEILAGFPSFRIGMVLFKDYNDIYLNKIIPFTDNFHEFQNELNAIRVTGGGDIPEAVYEALYEGAVKFDWNAQARLMFLIGDAPPHPRPRGKITKEMVDKAVREKEIKVHSMILPQ